MFYFLIIVVIVFIDLSKISIKKKKKPLEGGPGRKIPEQKPVEPIEDKATVLYLGRIPHGFYEKEMEGLSFFFFVV